MSARVRPRRRAALLLAASALSATATLAARDAHARGCREVSEVVGYHRCTSFGAGWAGDQLVVLGSTVGISVHTFGVDRMTFQTAIITPGGTRQTVTFAGDRLAQRTATSYSIDGTLYLQIAQHFYVGGLLELGLAPLAQTGPITDTNGVGVTPHTMQLATMGPFVGAGFAVGRLHLRGDVAGGVRLVSLWADPAGGTFPSKTGVSYVDWFVQPRAQVAFMLTSRLAVGAYGALDITPIGFGASFGTFLRAQM